MTLKEKDWRLMTNAEKADQCRKTAKGYPEWHSQRAAILRQAKRYDAQSEGAGEQSKGTSAEGAGCP